MEAPPGSGGALRVERYRVVIDSNLRVRPLSRTFLARRSQRDATRQISDGHRAWIERVPSEHELGPRRALLSALCRTPPLLSRWMTSHVGQTVREGWVVDDDLDLGDVHGILRTLAQGLPASVRDRWMRPLDGDWMDPLLDEFWQSFDFVAGGLAVQPLEGPAGILAPDPEVLVGRRLRTVGSVEVRILPITRARLDARRARFEAEQAALPAHHRIEPLEFCADADLAAARVLQRALLRAPDALDRLLRIEILEHIRNGLFCDLEEDFLRPSDFSALVERLSPEHQAPFLAAADEDDWYELTDIIYQCLEEETRSVSVFAVR